MKVWFNKDADELIINDKFIRLRLRKMASGGVHLDYGRLDDAYFDKKEDAIKAFKEAIKYLEYDI